MPYPFDPKFYPYPSRRNLVYAVNGLCASSHPMASQAGLEALKQGGNCVDAALAMAAALTVVDPASNGVGGDCFAIVNFQGRLYGLNSSGFAPALLNADELRQKGLDKVPLHGWAPVTVPGAPAGWAALGKRFGRLPLKQSFAPALKLAQGYALSPDNAPILNSVTRAVKESDIPEIKTWLPEFNPADRQYRAGDIYAMETLGETLKRIAETDGRDFYEGDIAEKIDAYARKTGGWLRGEDLAAYAPRWVEPVRTRYRDFEVCEIPPNGQGMTALIALNILEKLPLRGKDTVETLHLQMEAIKLAFADALHYIADPAFMPLKPEALLSKEYAAERAALVTEQAQVYAHGTPNRGDTVYFCAADGEGNSISMIQSLYMGFGSLVTVPGTGIALQNRGGCFSLTPGHANECAPRKYPYHTIIPGYLCRDGKPLGPFGIMGGYMQPQAHMQVVMNMADFGLNPQAALDAPRFCWTEGLQFDMEPGFNPDVISALRRRGHDIRVISGGQYGRGQIILHTPQGTLCGATEPRADGSVIGY